MEAVAVEEPRHPMPAAVSLQLPAYSALLFTRG